MQGVSGHGVFCDYLNVTFELESPANALLRDFLADLGYQSRGNPDLLCADDAGAVKIRSSTFWESWSLSGAVLDRLRGVSAYHELLGIVASYPHNVTKLDLARDQEHSDALSVARALDYVYRRGKSERFALGRKALPRDKIRYVQAPRVFDGVETGTVYWGDRRTHRLTARVYDKRKQMHDRHGVDLGYELVRTEVTAGKGKPCLSDALQGDSLFFGLASPGLLPRPSGISPWSHVEFQPLALEAPPSWTTMQRASFIIDNSPDLERLGKLLAKATPAERAKIRAKLDAHVDSLQAVFEQSGNARPASNQAH